MRIKVPNVVGALVVGMILGFSLGNLLARPAQDTAGPPVQAKLFVGLQKSSFVDNALMQRYANDLAGQFEARMIGGNNAVFWSQDLRVVAVPPVCLGSKSGCGTYYQWTFELRSHNPVDAQAAAIALGPGDVTMRSVVAPATSCGHIAPPNDDEPVAEQTIPESVSQSPCLSLGPLIHRLTGLVRSSYGPSNSKGPAHFKVLLEFQQDANPWLVEWARAHPDSDAAVLVSGWIVASVHAREYVNGIHGPEIVIESIDMKEQMAGAVDIAVSAPIPLLQVPATQP